MIHQLTLPTPFAVGDVHSYLVKGDQLTLFDVGPKTEQAREAIVFQLKELGYRPEDIEQVVLTHHHPDHSGWTELFPNAPLSGHAYNNVWFTRSEAFFNYHDSFYLDQLKEEGVPEAYHHWIEKMRRPIQFIGNRPLDHILKEGQHVPGHEKLLVIETLGHAQSQLSFYHRDEQWMIGGDHVIAHISSNPLIEPPLNPASKRPKALLQYNASLRRLNDLPISHIYSGHGNVVENVHVLIRERLAKQHARALQVREFMNGDAKTIFELTQTLFPKVYEKELGLTLSETIGQVDYLEDKGWITAENRDGVMVYQSV